MRWLALALTVTAGCGFDSSALLSGTSGDGGMVVPVVDAGEPDALDNASCPEGYSYFGGHGYRFVEDGMTFDEAAFFCQSEGGHLAVLDSPGEATFVRGLTAERPWVGLHDRVVEGQFEWVVPGSAEPDWSSGEPNDSGRGEDCAILWEGEQLNDGTCDDQRSFICECDGREPAQPPACAV
ncbi:MAG: C-type lectin domain-containing protein, partial [Deltaproteobacteria bacterium]|nr:C-type lectin domain-containing protein [Deltaproteobacteria bacterium]